MSYGRRSSARWSWHSPSPPTTASSARPTTPTSASPPASGHANISKAHRTARRLKAGTVWVNTYNAFDTALPFGGYKQSGWGRELGEGAIDLYTQVKAVNIQL
ncbi:aldehyde dehydrogenase family protein [Streptomyces griseoruber]|uniref:aldehyde dehydrogenase family protein n=1 Tax=Streptomyces griseoruber TaxID=1943 RepID=UPI0024681C7E|nr:aldehyde dehydrogenase family protein [Streptomyces griseoruber]